MAADKNQIPKAILFDYGNVIEGPLDPERFEAELASLASEYGFATGQDLWHHFYICNAWEQAKRGQITRNQYWLDRLEALGIEDEEGRAVFKQRMHQHRGVRTEMHDLLRRLRQQGYRLAIISNTSRPDLGHYLEERRGLANLFELVVSSAEVGLAKPDPDIYYLALRQLGIQPAEGLFIDDLERNTRAAEVVGIPSIVFTTPHNLTEELRQRGILDA